MKNSDQTSISRSDSPSIKTLAEASKPFKIPRLEGIRQTAEIFNLPVHFIRAAVANGDVVAVHAGRKILVNLDSLTAFLNTGVPQGAAVAAPRCSTDKTAPRISPISLR